VKPLLPIILLFLLFVTACAPDPRKEAESYRIKSEADQNAITQEQNRRHAEELHNLQMQQLSMDQENREAWQGQWQIAGSRAIWLGSLTIILAICFSIIVITRVTTKTIQGVGAALVRRADVSANLIKLDRVTRQFPLLVQHVHGSKFAIHNANTGSVTMLDTANAADRQLITTAGLTQLAGVIAQEAAKSQDPAGVSVIRPPVVNWRDDG
jgi:hypothetical protein